MIRKKKKRRKNFNQSVNPALKLKKKRQADRRAEQVQEAVSRSHYHTLRQRSLYWGAI